MTWIDKIFLPVPSTQRELLLHLSPESIYTLEFLMKIARNSKGVAVCVRQDAYARRGTLKMILLEQETVLLQHHRQGCECKGLSLRILPKQKGSLEKCMQMT